ncbi:MFS transporter [Streptomyces sp. NPDC047097]|uniref:MFS transporter n=1 Tax=Streptomyces sp. NPDC047097 TaxID=3155260 RepID=UPI0033CCC42C
MSVSSPTGPTGSAAASGPHAPPGSVRWALAGLAGAMLLSSLGTSVAQVALPTLAEAFGASFPAVQWVVLGYLLAVTSLLVAAGRLGDLVGRRRLMLGGLAVFTGASLLCGLAPGLWALVAARVAQGVGAAVMMALTMALVGGTVPKERTGSAMGLLGTVSAVGTALGPSLGGLLVTGLGWRAVFLLNVPPAAATWAIVRRQLPADHPRPTAASTIRFDHAGTAVLAATLTAYALAMTLGGGPSTTLNLALLTAAALGALLFVRIEARAAAPLLRPALLRRPGLGAGLTTSALVSTVMMTTLVVGPFHLSGALGLSAALAGPAMSTGPAVAALTGIPAGRLVDRLGAAAMTRLGLAVMATGCAALAVLPASSGVPGYLAPLAVTTAGYALFQTANNAGVMADVDSDQRGTVSGVLGLSRNLGLVTGTSVMGAVFAYAVGTGDLATAPPADVAAGTRTVFAVAAALSAAALLVAALATRRERPGRA